MKEKIQKIKDMLNELDSCIADEESQLFSQNYNAFELPAIISSIVEFLQPILTPYEVAIYWYLFNNSIVKTGEQYTRVSNKNISSCATSARRSGATVCDTAIKENLAMLKEKDVIAIVGDTNREGTLYKIFIPDEIPACIEAMKHQISASPTSLDIKKELDFYNVKENRLKIFERDDFKCHYCGKLLTRFSATLDHIQPVSKGGDNSFDNLITACLHCNSERGNKSISDFILDKK